MKKLSFYLIIQLFLITNLQSQSCKRMYKEKLENNSKLISCEYNYTIEKMKNGNCVFKRYYPENKMITQLITFEDESYKIKHGPFEERWDDGTTVVKGNYYNNLKEGEWIENENEVGYYEKDSKQGKWKEINDKDLVLKENSYIDNLLDGVQTFYDSLGVIEYIEVYVKGNLISTTRDTLNKDVESMPRFPGCEELNLSINEIEECSKNKFLQYMYGNLKYPRRSRKLNIEGKATIRFVVDTEGNTTDVKVLNGVSKDIKKMLIEMVEKMNRWIPGKQRGEDVKVLYTLPVVFKLE